MLNFACFFFSSFFAEGFKFVNFTHCDTVIQNVCIEIVVAGPGCDG